MASDQNLAKVASLAALLLLVGEAIAEDEPLRRAIPKPPELTEGVPQGDRWKNLLVSTEVAANWRLEPEWWRFDGAALVGESKTAVKHNIYGFSLAEYGDFEAVCQVRLSGQGNPNSALCIRMAPDLQNCLGYQVDMGKDYWGCLYEEKPRHRTIAPVPRELEAKLVRKDEWNQFYVHAQGHRIVIWLNGTMTVDIDDQPGPLRGRLGFQIIHDQAMRAEFRNLYLRPLAEAARP